MFSRRHFQLPRIAKLLVIIFVLLLLRPLFSILFSPSQPELILLNILGDLKYKERRNFSQNGEDGVTEALLALIGGPVWGYYVEIGTESGQQCNTRILRENTGSHPPWRGLLLDNVHSDPHINLHQETVTWGNVAGLLVKYQVPRELDLLSLDTDFKDYWILFAILQAGYRPRIIIAEVNSFIGDELAVTVPRDYPESFWDTTTDYFGFSVAAGRHLGHRFNYSMVYCESEGVNCFFVQDLALNKLDVLRGTRKIRISDYLTAEKLWKPPGKSLFQKPDLSGRPFTNVLIPANDVLPGT